MRRLGVITVDQAIAGGSNVLIAVLAAHTLGLAAFGLFGVVFLVYVLVQGVSRALVSDPLLLHPQEARERPGEAIGTAVVLGVAMGLALALIGLGVRFINTQFGTALVVLAAFVPLLVLQDLGRYIAFATRRPAGAVLLDTAWLVLQTAAVPVLYLAHLRTLAWFVAVWAGAGAVSGILTLVRSSWTVSDLGVAWLRRTWRLAWRYLISYVSTQSSSLLVTSAIGGITGARPLGAFQGTLLLVRPYVTFQVAAVSSGVTDIAHAAAQGAQIWLRARRTAAFATAVAVVNGAVMLALPAALGRLVTGSAWDAAQPLLLPMAIQIVALGATSGARAGLLGARALTRTLALDVTNGALMVSSTVVGALCDGVVGAVWAASVAQCVMTVLWWTALSRLVRSGHVVDHTPTRSAAVGSVEAA